MADPLLDPRNPDTPFHPQDGTVEVAPKRSPDTTSRRFGALAVFALFVLVLVAGGFVFAFGGFSGKSPVDKPAPGVGFTQNSGAPPHGPNALASPPHAH